MQVPDAYLAEYRNFAQKWLGHIDAKIILSFSDSTYNDEYYTGAAVEIGLYDNKSRRYFMDYDMQYGEDEQDLECPGCSALVDEEDAFCSKCGTKLDKAKMPPRWTSEDAGTFFSELNKLPFVWSGKHEEIKL